MSISRWRFTKFLGGVAARTTWKLTVTAYVPGSSARMAQNLTGEIDGTIHDSSGAVIPNATVTVKNTAQNTVTRTVKLDKQGHLRGRGHHAGAKRTTAKLHPQGRQG